MAQYSEGAEVEIGIAKEFKLDANYPNPFNPSTTIEYTIPQESHVTMKVFDFLGREDATLVNEKKEAGRYSVEWDGSARSSGIYFYTLQARAFRETERMILIKSRHECFGEVSSTIKQPHH